MYYLYSYYSSWFSQCACCCKSCVLCTRARTLSVLCVCLFVCPSLFVCSCLLASYVRMFNILCYILATLCSTHAVFFALLKHVRCGTHWTEDRQHTPKSQRTTNCAQQGDADSVTGAGPSVLSVWARETAAKNKRTRTNRSETQHESARARTNRPRRV